MSSQTKLATLVTDLVLAKIKYSHDLNPNDPMAITIKELITHMESEVENHLKSEGLETRHFNFVKNHMDEQVFMVTQNSEASRLVAYLEGDFVELAIKKVKANGSISDAEKERQSILLKALTIHYRHNEGLRTQQVDEKLTEKITAALAEEVRRMFLNKQ